MMYSELFGVPSPEYIVDTSLTTSNIFSLIHLGTSLNMKHFAITVASATILICQAQSQHAHSGRGKIECFHGSCHFFIDSQEDTDHPGRYAIGNAFQFIATGGARISGKTKADPSHELCYYKEATETGTDEWWKLWNLQIDERCSINTHLFEDEKIFSGPGLLECTEGTCYNYGPFDDCGSDIQDASEDWGKITLLRYASEDVAPTQAFSGFNSITTMDAIEIDDGCSLRCSGCQFTRQPTKRLRG
eukprot:scaffold6090_cov79-Cyclotella_meneghiniana.AAC.14